MQRTFCDKCGKEISKKDGEVELSYTVITDNDIEELQAYDLCLDCKKKLEEFLKIKRGKHE